MSIGTNGRKLLNKEITVRKCVLFCMWNMSSGNGTAADLESIVLWRTQWENHDRKINAFHGGCADLKKAGKLGGHGGAAVGKDWEIQIKDGRISSRGVTA